MSETWVQSGSGLHRAITDQRIRQVRLLVGLGMDVDKRDSAGRTPIMVACSLDSEELSLKVIRLCLKKGADINRVDSAGRSVLSHACMHGREAIVAFLLEEDSLEKNLPDQNGDTPLNLAAARGELGCLELLVRSLTKDGIPVDYRNKQGCTALLLATKGGHYRCAQVLLQQGRSSVNSRDNECFMNPTEWARHSQKLLERDLQQRTRAHQSSLGAASTGASLLGNHHRVAKPFLPPIGIKKWYEEEELLTRQRQIQESMNALVQSLEEREKELRDQGADNQKPPPTAKPSSFASTVVFPDGPTKDHYLCALFRLYQDQLLQRPTRLTSRPTTVPGAGTDPSTDGHLGAGDTRRLSVISANPKRPLLRRQMSTLAIGGFMKTKLTLTVN
ncbi:serine/threonine-protein phosphatase 6 regulatory ankyrin repeat subunit C-like [Acanthaster planci]|uniref:Serine/threonine-protein phosphatase 6 regulatory ankyrin repeat subunit C-like n=1 Tax=Acanthaster planci TaxID=133434 RepID=A0A8B7Z9I0_ACAPL|nr:serine/threonine-protein phosphatase 6 regulatory ankyrin repeat subunit C-like [Acanthaster planci]